MLNVWYSAGPYSTCIFSIWVLILGNPKQNSLTEPHCKYLQFFIVSTFHCNLAVRFTFFKGQLISKTIYGVLDSPKKRTKTIWLHIS